MGSGPVDDDLLEAVLVINFEASLDTTINKRTVFKTLGCISDVGGFVTSLLLITLVLVTMWNEAFVGNFLV